MLLESCSIQKKTAFLQASVIYNDPFTLGVEP